MRDVLAVILGGGQGSRLFPLTQERSKPAVPLGGKYRLIDIPVSNCLNSAVTKIFVAEQTPENVNWYQGTADAVRQNLRHFTDWQMNYVLILSGDHLYRMDYREFMARHKSTNADVTVSVTPVAETDASSYGLLKTDDDVRIIEFSEKPTGDALQ